MTRVSKPMVKKEAKKEIKTEIKREAKSEAEVQVKVEVPVRALDNRDPNIPTTNGTSQSIKNEYVLQDAITHLCSVDHRFEPLFSRYIPKPWTAEGMSQPKCHFKSLTLSIMSQQVSGAAARSIGKKFVGLFRGLEHSGVSAEVDMDPEVEDEPKVKLENGVEGNVPASDVVVPPSAAPVNDALADAFYPTAEQVAASDVMYLKSAGLSLRKAEYIQGIAQAFANKDLTDEFFATADDDAIKSKLVSLRGIGPWSAEMFMVGSSTFLELNANHGRCSLCSGGTSSLRATLASSEQVTLFSVWTCVADDCRV